MDRRQFVRLGAGMGVLGLPALLQACVPSSRGNDVASTTTAVPSSALTLPTYVPFTGVLAELPGTAEGVPNGYLSFPQNPLRSVPQPPGKGGEMSIMGWTVQPPAPPVDQNVAWREVNRQMNVDLKVAFVSLNDYLTQVSTTIASGNLPDAMVLSINGSSLQGLPDFLNASCADLTPFLSGDAIKEFPNLANFPPFAWPNSVVNGHMYFIPVLGGVGGNSMMVKQKALDAAGVQSITTADEFIQAARAVTIPGTQYAIGSNVAITSPLQWFLPMFGAPNGWRESGGKLTRDLETQEFADAVAYVRSLWDAGVIHPDLPGMSALQTSQNFYSGKIVMYLMNLAAFPLVWRQSLAQDPEFDPRIIKPFSHDGKSAGGQFVGPGANGLTVLKKAEPDRVKEVLGVLNFLAAPFGTQEMLLRLYGVQGTDFNFDDKGNPELTQPGMQDVSVPYQAVISMPESFYYPTLPPDAVRTVYQAEVDAFAVGVRSPLVGLYSRADGDSGAVLQQHVNDGINSIIYGREPVTTLSQIVTDWRTNGGDTIRTEYERALQSSKT